MNKKLSMAVAGAVMAMGASAANAGITIPAGDWTIDIGGNVNAFYTHTKFDGDFDAAGTDDTANVIQTGLLPSAIGIGGKTRQNDLDVAFQFTFFTGVDAGGSHASGGNDAVQGAGSGNTLNIRQAYLTFGDKSWGTIKMGRDLGIFESDAILSDMTLLGVGHAAGAGGNSTLGRIGQGYIYADWVGQISYASPNWNGFSFAVGLREPWTNGSSQTDRRSNMGYEGKVSYEWAGDVAGKVWAGFISQKHDTDTGSDDSYRSDGFDIGGKVNVGPFGLVASYYNGDGLAGASVNGGILGGLPFLANNETDDDGYYVQGTWTAPFGTKFGASYGRSNSEADDNSYDIETDSWIIGAYHPITKSLNLVAEYTDADYEDQVTGGFDGEAKTVSLGAILFF